MTQGIEIDADANSEDAAPDNAIVVRIEDHHQRLIQVELLDVTDRNNQLVHSNDIGQS